MRADNAALSYSARDKAPRSAWRVAWAVRPSRSRSCTWNSAASCSSASLPNAYQVLWSSAWFVSLEVVIAVISAWNRPTSIRSTAA